MVNSFIAFISQAFNQFVDACFIAGCQYNAETFTGKALCGCKANTRTDTNAEESFHNLLLFCQSGYDIICKIYDNHH